MMESNIVRRTVPTMEEFTARENYTGRQTVVSYHVKEVKKNGEGNEDVEWFTSPPLQTMQDVREWMEERRRVSLVPSYFEVSRRSVTITTTVDAVLLVE